VQYATVDPTNNYLYVSASDFKNSHIIAAFKINQATGALSQHGNAINSPARAINVSVDGKGKYLVLAHNQTRSVSVVELNTDGTLGKIIPQTGDVDSGFFPHQAKFTPDGTHVIVSGLGAAPKADGTPEELGQLTVFKFENGQLTKTQTITPGAGVGFRHIDFHPTRNVIYSAVERSNQLMTFALNNGVLTQVSAISTLEDPSASNQRAGAIHVHPNGKYLYVSNRNTATENKTIDGKEVAVYTGGVNDITLFSLNDVANPAPVARYDTRGLEPRTFTIAPTGNFLIVGNQVSRNVLKDNTVTAVTPNIAVFRVLPDGKLEYLRKYDLTGGDVFWVGTVGLP
jgi:6-phosphogluconolactonase (cycloisomerase 2 family)